MSFTGDFAQLRALAARFKQVEKAMPRIVHDMGAESLNLTRQSFRAQQSPDGASWVAGPSVSSPMLRKSGKLAGSIAQLPGATAFGLRVGARYGIYHQVGAHLRDPVVGSAGRLRTLTRGPGRGKSGPRRKLKQQGPRRKGRLRGFLPQRRIIPGPEYMPARWAPFLSRIADRQVERALGF